MNCTIDAKLLSNIVESVKDLNPHVNFDFTESGLHFQIMDTAHVSLSHLSLPKDTFKEYTCKKTMALGINLRSLNFVLKGSTGDVTMQSQADKVKISVEKNSGSAVYMLHLLNVEGDYLDLSSEAYDAKAVIGSYAFGKMMKDMSEFSDTCHIHIQDQLTVSASGDIGQVEWKSTESECHADACTPPLLFSLPYLQLFSKASTVSKQIVLEMKGEEPLRITFPVGSGFLRFYLAPKIEDDE